MPTAPPASRFWPWYALAVWVAASVFVAIHAYRNPRGHTLYDIYAIGIRNWWHGVDLYPRQAETGELFRYSPAFALTAGPFALLPPGAGNATWKLFNLGAFALGLAVWAKRGQAGPLSANRTAALFLVAFPIVMGNVYNGQANLLVMGLVLLALAAVARDRWWGAATALAAATLIKVFPVALALVLCVLYWRTLPLRFVAALALGLLVPLVAQNPEYAVRQTGEWLHHLSASTELNRDRLKSLDKLFEVAGAGVSRPAFQALAAGAGALVLAAGTLAVRRGEPRPAVLFQVGAWFVTWVVLFSPSSEAATFSVLGPFLAWATVEAFRRPRAWVERAWLVACVYLVGPSDGDTGKLTRWMFETYPATTLGALGFQLWLCLDLARRARAARPAHLPDSDRTSMLRNATGSLCPAKPK
ncbi:MAG: DUF2029 domain-containing protein [Planctomycetes bacterium]|nr:DUF2029 domain-containing protein [Planctomycetota bacterium]